MKKRRKIKVKVLVSPTIKVKWVSLGACIFDDKNNPIMAFLGKYPNEEGAQLAEYITSLHNAKFVVKNKEKKALEFPYLYVGDMIMYAGEVMLWDRGMNQYFPRRC